MLVFQQQYRISVLAPFFTQYICFITAISISTVYLLLEHWINTALIIIFVSKIKWMITYCVKGVWNGAQTELLLNSADQCSILFTSSFWFYGEQLHSSDLLSLLSLTQFPAAAGSCFQWKSSNKPSVHFLFCCLMLHYVVSLLFGAKEPKNSFMCRVGFLVILILLIESQLSSSIVIMW